MNRVAATLLVLEAVVVMLAIPVAVVVSDVEPAVAIPAGLGIGVLCVAAAGLLRRGRVGYVLGSLVQVAATATGFVVPVMFFLGGLFALLWVVLLRIGPDVDRARAEGNP
ncbi:MAG TPA: DUF4233 domain-containing protein [Jiangellaceae bacterium]